MILPEPYGRRVRLLVRIAFHPMERASAHLKLPPWKPLVMPNASWKVAQSLGRDRCPGINPVCITLTLISQIMAGWRVLTVGGLILKLGHEGATPCIRK